MDWWEQILLIAFWGIGGGIFTWVIINLFEGQKVSSIAMLTFVIGFLIRALLIVVNEEFQFIPEKLAGNFSLQHYDYFFRGGHGISDLLGEEFAAQVFLNLPAWILFGAERISLLMSNACVGAIAAPVAAGLLYRPLGDRAAIRALVLISIYPGALNFSIFGLRDPLIFTAMVILACGVARSWLIGMTFRNIGLVVISASLTLWLRPELAYVVFMVAMIPIINLYLAMLQGARRSQKNYANLIVITLPLILVGLLAVVAATRIASSNIGATTANPFEIAGEASTNRFERHTHRSFGAGSNVMTTESYASLPIYLRIPVQTAGMIVLPFPWQIRNAQRLFAFGDSMLLMGMILFVCVNLRFASPFRQAGAGRLTAMLMLVFLVGILGMGFVVSNSGNGFRMRLAVTPLLFVAASTVPVLIRLSLGRTKKPLRSFASRTQALI
ncbi:MAG: hypothetical protein AB8B91_17410 [Rubripirellula sp.]